MGGAGVVGGVGRIGKVDHRLPGLGLGQQRGQEGHLRGGIGLAGHGRGQLVREAQPVQQVGQARYGVAHPVAGGQPRGNGPAFGVQVLPQLLGQARELGAGEQAPVAGLFGLQIPRQALFPVRLRVAVHRRLVQA